MKTEFFLLQSWHYGLIPFLFELYFLLECLSITFKLILFFLDQFYQWLDLLFCLFMFSLFFFDDRA